MQIFILKALSNNDSANGNENTVVFKSTYADFFKRKHYWVSS